MLWIVPVPGIVCAAFSIELGFKALAAQASGSTPWGHDLLNLFERIEPWQQNEISQLVGVEIDHLRAELSRTAKAFEYWRYAHEHTELSIGIGLLEKLSEATQQVLSRVNAPNNSPERSRDR
jgi:HEPN domain-containing protein